MKHRCIILIALLCGVALLAGCGGDDKDDSNGNDSRNGTEVTRQDFGGVETLQLSGLQPVREVLADDVEYRPDSLFISPDGTLLYWWQFERDEETNNLCHAPLADPTTPVCVPMPENAVIVTQPTWSPDGQWIAFTEDPFIRFHESDIWLVNAQTGETHDLTDDGVLGSHFNEEAPYNLDYLPMWRPDGSLYFFRVVSSERFADEPQCGIYLMRIEAAEITRDATPEQVYVASGEQMCSIPIWHISNRYALSGAAISPDGSQIAILYRPNDPDIESEVWLVSLEDGTQRVLASEAQITSLGMPEWIEARTAILEGLAWAEDGRTLVVATTNPAVTSGPQRNVVTIDVATGNVTPVFDFSGVADEQAAVQDPLPSGLTARAESPRALLVTPAGDGIFTINFGLDTFGISLIPLPLQSGSAPLRLTLPEGDFGPTGPITWTSFGENEQGASLIMGAYLISFTRTP